MELPDVPLFRGLTADEAEAADDHEDALRNASSERPNAVPVTQIGGEASSSDDGSCREAGDQHGARGVGPLVVHGERVGRHVQERAADDRGCDER